MRLRDNGYHIDDVPGLASGDGDALIHALIERGWAGPGLADRGPAGRPVDQNSGGPLPGLVRRPARRTPCGRGPALGRPARRAVRRSQSGHRGRDRGRDHPGRQRRDPDPAAARLRREPDRDLPRSRPAAQPPLPRRPTAGCAHEFGAHAVVHLGKHGTLEWLPGKNVGMSADLRPRRRARRPAADLPVPGQRPGRGHAGQAPRARHDRRPPDPADGPRRDLRRHRPARAAARRARQHRRDGPGQAARDPPADLDADAARPRWTTTSG